MESFFDSLATDYTTFCNSLEGGTASSFHLGSIHPFFIVEKVYERGSSLKRESCYYSCESLSKPLQRINDPAHFLFLYGRIVSVSPSKEYCLLLDSVKTVDSHSEKKQFTVWDVDNNQLVSQCVLESSLNTTLLCNVNNIFAGFSWNETNKTILFSSCFGSNELYGYEMPWFTDTECFHSAIFCYDYHQSVINLCPYSSHYAYGQPLSIDDDSFFSIGWHETPNHESMNAFNTLPSSLLVINRKEGITNTIDLQINPQFIRYDQTCDLLLIVGPRKDILVHSSSMQVVSYSLQSHQTTLLVDHQSQPLVFYSGMFIASIPNDPFINNGTQMIVNCFHSHQIKPFLIDVLTPHIPTPLINQDSLSSVEYLFSYQNEYVFRGSSPSKPPSLYYLSSQQSLIQIDSTQSYSSQITYQTFMSSPESGCECILYQNPSVKENHSLIVLLHGGPHRLFHAVFNSDILFYLKKGFSVLVPNYHGSYGYGDSFLHCLCGHLGDIEVNDVIDAVEKVVSESSFHIDRTRVFGMGSSYGGFIILHTLEKQPNLFKKVIIRNPVVDPVAMVTSSDMNYWMYVLAGIVPSQGEWNTKVQDMINGEYVYTDEDLAVVRSFSPMNQVNKIQTPICFILGKKDCRVINQQSFKLIQYLRAQKKEVEVLMNPNDNHFLTTPLSRTITCAKVCTFFN